MSFLPADLPDDFSKLEEVIAERESQAHPLKQRTEAQICWNGPQKKKTPYSIVYLHGFKASHPEGYPVHQTVAKHFGCNLYLSRLYGHGQIKAHRLGDLSAQKLIQSAKDACRVGQKIGEKVILMGTSTGGTLALHLAGESVHQSAIAGLILYSPLIHLYGIQSLLLENNLSRRLLSFIPGKNYLVRSADPFSPPGNNIWYRSYWLNGALALGETVQKIIKPSLFKQITCPAFIGYYYKNRHNHDRIVSTAALKRVAKKLGTSPEKLVVRNFSDANSHVICNSLLSNAVQDVILETKHFLTKQMKLKASSATHNETF